RREHVAPGADRQRPVRRRADVAQHPGGGQAGADHDVLHGCDLPGHRLHARRGLPREVLRQPRQRGREDRAEPGRVRHRGRQPQGDRPGPRLADAVGQRVPVLRLQGGQREPGVQGPGRHAAARGGGAHRPRRAPLHVLDARRPPARPRGVRRHAHGRADADGRGRRGAHQRPGAERDAGGAHGVRPADHAPERPGDHPPGRGGDDPVSHIGRGVLLRFRTPARRDDDGAALVLVVGSMLVLAMLALTALAYAIGSQRFARYTQDYTSGMAAAQSGIEHYISQLNRNDRYSDEIDCSNPALNGPMPPSTNSCGYTMSTEPGWAPVDPANTAPEAPHFHYSVDASRSRSEGTIVLTVTGRVNGEYRTVEAVVGKGGSTDFVYYTD